jgi:hypothetical protein
MRLRRSIAFIGIDLLLIAIAFLFFTASWQVTHLRVERTVFTTNAYRTPLVTDAHPIWLPPGTTQAELTTDFTLGWIHPVLLQFRPNDCLESIRLNDYDITSTKIPYCNHLQDQTIRLGQYLRTGNNTLYVHLRNHGGDATLAFSVPWYDPIRISLLICACIPLIIIFWKHTKNMRGKGQKTEVLLGVAIAGGVLLRVFYLAVTPFLIRGHDVWGHIEYIEYMAEYWSIPLARDGWQFYHPPLYYMLTGAWYAIGASFGRGRQMLIGDVQMISLVLSVITFVLAAVWIGKLLFPKKTEQTERTLFAAILATFPSFVFFAGRINNDVLLLFWSVLGIGYLLVWWRHQGKRMLPWFFCIVMIALGTLTKSNALLLIPAPFICLVMLQSMKWRKRIAIGCMGILLFVLLTGWHAFLRFGVEKHTSVVANITHLNQNLRVDNSVRSFTTFAPSRIVQEPYNDPFDEQSGRRWFFEYLFKSAFFGEFHFGSGFYFLSSLILLNALVLLPIIGIGLWQACTSRLRTDLPMLLVLLFSIGGHLLYRQTAPFSSSQDFRYSIVSLLPLAYFLITGIRSMPQSFQRPALAVAYGGVCFCALFLGGIGPI